MKSRFLTHTALAFAFALSLSGMTVASAACKAEKLKYRDAHKKCIKYSAASETTAPTLIGGLIFGGVAHNQCRISKERLRTLDRCMSTESRADAMRAEQARAQAEAAAQAQTELDAFVTELIMNGYDLSNPAVVVEISAMKLELEASLALTLESIESERQAALSSYQSQSRS